MGHDRSAPPESITLDQLSLPERLAVWVLRCIGHEPRPCHAGHRRTPPGFLSELHDVIGQFEAFQMQMHAEGWAGLHLAEWGALHLSRDERRLLRALAACQAGQTGLADNFLFRFAPRSVIRSHLTQAVAALAATLAAGGYWLPQPMEAGRFTVTPTPRRRRAAAGSAAPAIAPPGTAARKSPPA